MVGMAKSVSAEYSYILVPEKEKEADDSYYDPYLPYQDDTYVKVRKDINYGITYSISIETIRHFFEKNEDIFSRKGYHISRFTE